MTVRILLSLWVLAWFAVPLSAQHKLVDFQRIVTVAAPCPVQQTAAAELAEYVGRMTGKPLAVIGASEWNAKADGLSFFVGDAARLALDADPAPWQHEEYLLRSVPQGLVLAGDDDPKGNPWTARTRAGSLLATYTLLDDHLGVHWFWPGPFGEHVPQGGDATVPVLNIRATPRLLIRSIELGIQRITPPSSKSPRGVGRGVIAWPGPARPCSDIPGSTPFNCAPTRAFARTRTGLHWLTASGGLRRCARLILRSWSGWSSMSCKASKTS